MKTFGNDAALAPAPVFCPAPKRYAAAHRRWQGIPAIERTPGGRLWAAWYSGGEGERPENHIVLVTSEDDGYSWTEPVLAIDPPDVVRAFDPCLWHCPDGRLWLFWAQSYEHFDGRCGVWAMTCEDSEVAMPAWSDARRICNGIMMNKPTVRSNEEWLLPVAIWYRGWTTSMVQPDWGTAPEAEWRSNVVASADAGRTFTRIGGADVQDRTADEHMIVERRDRSLWMLVRTKRGIGESVSTDGGMTWSPGKPTSLPGPDARFHVRRLASGALLMVNHTVGTERSHLAATLSDDDGATWQGGLMLDERTDVSYPDAAQATDGRVYVIYDRERGDEEKPGAKEILMAVITEDDVRAGEPTTDACRLKQIVSKIGSG